METFALNLQSKNQIAEYLEGNSFARHEREVLTEILEAIEQNNVELLEWYSQFGDSLRTIYMNVHAYRKNIEFGFMEIEFGDYGWFIRPVFLDKEEMIFGNPYHYSEHSTVDVGRGLNNIWTYGLHYSFGTAGGCFGLSVYGTQFKSRDEALTFGMNELKAMMAKKIGSTDTSNHKQHIINSTIKDIIKAQLNMVQLTLF
jgi:hypothetical protein